MLTPRRTPGSSPSDARPIELALDAPAGSPEAHARVAELRADGATPRAALVHPDGSRTILMGTRPPFVLPTYVPSYTPRAP
jgi:hypothetical protein